MHRPTHALRAAAAVAGLALAGAVLAVGGGADDAKDPPAFHEDPKALERAVLDTVRALLRDDAASAREATDRVEAACRRLDAEDIDRFGRDLATLDRGLHAALARARQAAARGRAGDAFDSFVWVLRSCRQCHAVSGVNPSE